MKTLALHLDPKPVPGVLHSAQPQIFMKKILKISMVTLVLMGLASTAPAAIIVNQTSWPDGDSTVLKTNQNLPSSMGWQCSTATSYSGTNGTLVVNVGTGSRTWWAYFADTNTPVQLGVGQEIRCTVNFTVFGVGAQNGNRHLRYALLHSGVYQQPLTNSGTIRNDNLTGYGQSMNFGTSFGLPPFSAFADTNSVDGQAVISKSTELDGIGDDGGGTTNDPAFTDGVPYTLILSVTKTASDSVDITTTVFGSTLNNGMITQTVTDTTYAYTNFDTFVMRPNASTTTATNFTFTGFKIELLSPSDSGPIQLIDVTMPAANSTEISWNSVSGAYYSVLRTNDASANTTNWPVIATGIVGNGGVISFTDTNATDSVGFYRVSSP